MTAQTALIHLGMPKTGSTFLQAAAQQTARSGEHAAYLWEPWAQIVNSAFEESHGGLRYAVPGAAHRPMQAPPNKPVFASNETLVGVYPRPLRFGPPDLLRPAQMKDFQVKIAEYLAEFAKKHFANFDVHILLVVRAPKKWTESLYKDFIISGKPEPTDLFWDRYGETLKQLYNAPFLKDLYEQYFGTDRVHLLPFELLLDDPSQFRRTVNGLLGSDLIADDAPPQNVNLSEPAIASLRRIWQGLDAVVPPRSYTWDDPNIKFKWTVGKFVIQEITNSAARVEAANAILDRGETIASTPQAYVDSLRDVLRPLRGLPQFDPFLTTYGLA